MHYLSVWIGNMDSDPLSIFHAKQKEKPMTVNAARC